MLTTPVSTGAVFAKTRKELSNGDISFRLYLDNEVVKEIVLDSKTKKPIT